jgi:hypothetical protein
LRSVAPPAGLAMRGARPGRRRVGGPRHTRSSAKFYPVLQGELLDCSARSSAVGFDRGIRVGRRGSVRNLSVARSAGCGVDAGFLSTAPVVTGGVLRSRLACSRSWGTFTPIGTLTTRADHRFRLDHEENGLLKSNVPLAFPAKFRTPSRVPRATDASPARAGPRIASPAGGATLRNIHPRNASGATAWRSERGTSERSRAP